MPIHTTHNTMQSNEEYTVTFTISANSLKTALEGSHLRLVEGVSKEKIEEALCADIEDFITSDLTQNLQDGWNSDGYEGVIEYDGEE